MMLDQSLLLLARSLLYLMPPPRALSVLRFVGGKAPPLRTAQQAMAVTKRLRGGSCLARSLTVAARAPSAAVAIGVERRAGQSLFAHAWVEMDGQPIDPAEPAGERIAYLTNRIGSTEAKSAATLRGSLK